MRKTLLLGALLAVGFQLKAQDIYAVTGAEKGKIEFQDFRSIDAKTGVSGEILLKKADKVDFKTHQTFINNRFVAAMTMLDGKIFYIPMTLANVYMIDPRNNKGTITKVEKSTLDHKNIETLYTRMTTGSDGYVYAINNIGSEFLRISEYGEVENLGAITSLMEQFKSLNDTKQFAGGDMIADNQGNLYVISAFGNVFRVSPDTLEANFLGKISGLPEKYTINGAAVTRDGKILLATTSEHGFYVADFNTLEATFSHHYDTPIYDLYSPYFVEIDLNEQIAKSAYSLYPTIVKNSELNIISNSSSKEKLDVSVWNLNNKKIYSNTIAVQSIGEFKVNLNGALQPGIYVLKATNQNGQEVINTKFTLVR